MPRSQVERLRRDSKELSHYIQKLKKEGNQQKVFSMIKKREFIERQLSDMEEYS
jgi:hypothetical protein